MDQRIYIKMCVKNVIKFSNVECGIRRVYWQWVSKSVYMWHKRFTEGRDIDGDERSAVKKQEYIETVKK